MFNRLEKKNSPEHSVVVLGMHRSGTSVVTRVINLLGLPICRDDDLQTGPDNPTGHWESASLINFNDRILKMFGGTVEAPSLMSFGWEESEQAKALHDEASKVFKSAFPTDVWVWKDPRTCLTLPFWRDVWTSMPVAVLVYREPLEIFISMHKRNGISKAHCIALWERYLRSALLGSVGMPLVIIDYDDLLRNPATAVSRLSEEIGRLGVAISGNVAQAAECVSTTYGKSRELNYSLERDPDVTQAQKSLIATVRTLPKSSAQFSAPDLGNESASTTELLHAVIHKYPPSFRVTAIELWPAFQRAMARRLQPGSAPVSAHVDWRW